MNTFIITTFIATVWAFAATQNMAFPHDANNSVQNSVKHSKLEIQNLRSDKLAGVENTEVIVSRVVIPPHTTLPKHWHPGEEFAYIIEGSVTLWQDGKTDIIGNAGDVVKVPLKQIHTAKTSDEGAVILVFRVHQSGKPGRYLVK